MSLRLRLTLLYTTLLGGVLLLFCILVYGLVSVILLDQIDNTLTIEANRYIGMLRVNSANQFDPRSIINFQPSENLYVQVWGKDGKLQLVRPPGKLDSIDEIGRRSGRPLFNTSTTVGMHMRVVSIPLTSERGSAGVLQMGLNLNLIDITQHSLASILTMLSILAMLLAGLAVYLVTDQAMAPLTTVTQVATQITKADDLSRRIPLTGSGTDEVGRLILAFNATLLRLEQLFTVQRRFMADVSHELRTPLTVIKGNVGLLRRMGNTDEESLSGIEAEVDRLTRMVNDLLLLAQAESGKLPLDMSPVELDAILLDVVQQMSMLSGDRQQLRIKDIDEVLVTGDRDRLKQVILNLISNAVQYTPVGGQINISLKKVKQQSQLLVSDTGPGISAEDLPHIFERFYRGEKSRKRGPGTGFGLGLSIAYWIVRNHGGSIEASSQEGKGTTFCVWLPLRSETTVEHAEHNETAQS
jgi:two-component system, OmpR family, sensor kinase